MRRGPRGGPGQGSARLARAEALLATTDGASRAPLELLAAVLRHHVEIATPVVAGQPVVSPFASQFPLNGVVEAVGAAVSALHDAVPAPLGEVGTSLVVLDAGDLAALVDTWFHEPDQVDPRVGFWLQVAAGPSLEAAAQSTEVPADWQGSACPVCGALPQASVIAEESGEFMAGSPRSLVCGRCATWWPFPRATCVGCHQEDPRLLDGFLEDDRRWARVDTCSACRTYVKTFDLRQPGARDVVPLVDDVATLTLDIWAQQHGYTRPSPSLAGV